MCLLGYHLLISGLQSYVLLALLIVMRDKYAVGRNRGVHTGIV